MTDERRRIDPDVDRGVPDSAPPEESEHKDEVRRSALGGAAAGAVVGGIAAGPLGAIAGGVVGAAAGAANKADEDEPATTGNPTDDDPRRVKRTYSGKIYEEGSTQDVRRQDEI